MNNYVGVDLGGTTLRVAVVDTETGEFFGLAETQALAREGQEAVIAGSGIGISLSVAFGGLMKQIYIYTVKYGRFDSFERFYRCVMRRGS